MIPIEILQASKNDLHEILALQKQAYQSEAILYNDYTIPPLTQTLEAIQNEFTKSVFLKAVFEGKIIGSVRVSIENNRCKIGKLIVSPELQRRGIGSSLMRHVESMFPSVDSFELFTGSKSVNNLYLYEKLGYTAYKQERLSPQVTIVFLQKKVLS